MTISALYTVFFMVNEKDRKNLFIAGFLAPSILLTLFNVNYNKPEESKKEIKSSVEDVEELSFNFTDLLIPSAYAQDNHPVQGKTIKKEQFEPSFADGVYSELGIKQTTQADSYANVIGKSKNSAVLQRNLEKLKNIYEIRDKVKIVTPKGSPYGYIVVGSFGTNNDIILENQKLKELARTKYADSSRQELRNIAKMLLGAKIIDMRDTFAN
jgi:hypothetical protein